MGDGRAAQIPESARRQLAAQARAVPTKPPDELCKAEKDTEWGTAKCERKLGHDGDHWSGSPFPAFGASWNDSTGDSNE